jgi:hypothetical protein
MKENGLGHSAFVGVNIPIPTLRKVREGGGGHPALIPGGSENEKLRGKFGYFCDLHCLGISENIFLNRFESVLNTTCS